MKHFVNKKIFVAIVTLHVPNTYENREMTLKIRG